MIGDLLDFNLRFADGSSSNDLVTIGDASIRVQAPKNPEFVPLNHRECFSSFLMYTVFSPVRAHRNFASQYKIRLRYI